ncbi:substrate-binding domain-containing protein [Neisseriaceae bacterium TC5R-5]|nr:substrate-binding domain-containing protein [Neisseriaceae bacterium TC5R-5]
MMKILLVRVSILLCLALGGLIPSTWAADIYVVSSGGFAAAYRALAPGFEQRTGHKLMTGWGPSMGKTPQAIPQRLARGEQIDVLIMVDGALQDLIQQGRVQPSSHTILANSRIAMAVRRGAIKPDISTLEQLKAVLLSAKSIAYSDSASGVYLSSVLFPRLGISEQLKDKAWMVQAEPVGQLVARGDAEIGFQQLSELVPIAGIDIVGLLPDEAQKVTPFSATILADSQQPEAAKALIDYLTSAEAAPFIRKTGLDPLIDDAQTTAP